MRRLIVKASLVLALGVGVVPLVAAPAQALPACTSGYTTIENPLLWYLHNSGGTTRIVRGVSSGNVTNYCRFGSSPMYVEQADTNLCLTWNASHGYVDEVACNSLLSQRWYRKAGSYAGSMLYNGYAGSGYCLEVVSNGGEATLKGCSKIPNQIWLYG
jgi:hypothetical protein